MSQGVATPPAPAIAQPQVNNLVVEDQDWRIDAALDVLDKQYRLYDWNDQKTASLITTNSVLFAAIGFIFSSVQSDVVALVLITAAMLVLSASLMLSLVQVVPQQSSRKTGTDKNIRSMRGIAMHDTWQDYNAAFKNLTADQYLTDTTRQIYGMRINNDKSRDLTTKGTWLTAIAVVLVALSVVKVSYSIVATPTQQSQTSDKTVDSTATSTQDEETKPAVKAEEQFQPAKKP